MMALKEYINEQNKRRGAIDVDYGREFESKLSHI